MKNTKALTEGAIFAAIYGIISFMTVGFPILSSVLIWLLPLPFIIYTVRHGWKHGVMLVVVALFLSFILGRVLFLFSALMIGSSGVVIGELVRRKKAAFSVLLGGSLAYICNFILFFILSIVVFDLHPIKLVQEIMMDSVSAAEAMLLTLGQEPNAQLSQLTDFIDQLIYLAPALIISTAVFYALITQLFSYAILKRIGEKVYHFKPFREWSFPKSFLWYYLVTSIFVIVGIEEGTNLYIVIWNLFPLLEIVMTIQGLTVVFYYCHAKKIKRIIPITVVIVSIVIAPFLLFIYRILGIIDLGFDLRKRIKNSN